jgi:hypothetical protein
MKPVLLRSDRGFVLPLTVGVGAILMLLGTMMIIRSSQGDRSAIAAKTTSRSLAVAEASVTNIQSLMNRYKALSTYTYCSKVNTPVNLSDPKCSDVASNTTWSSVSDKNFCGTPPSTRPGEDYANLVKDYSDDFLNDTWQNGNGGQFRLVRYVYTPEAPGVTSIPRRLGSSELLVEGRVNQENNGSASYRTSTTRLEVTFENWMERLTNTEINVLPTLWIRANQDSGVGSSVTFSPSTSPSVGFSIWDSTSPGTCDHAKVQQFRSLLISADDTYKLTSPELSFPTLPPEGNVVPSPPTPGSVVYSVPSITNSSPSAPSPSFPISGQVVHIQSGGSHQITYLTPPINLANGQKLEIKQPNPTISNLKTVALYVNGDLTIQEGGQISVESGIQLKLYAHGAVTMNSSSSTKAIDSDSVTNLFGYTANPIVISGNSEIKLFVLAPSAPIRFENSAKVSGAVWARSWIGGDSTSLVREFSSDFLSQFPVDIPRMRPVSSWRRCPVDQPTPCPN